MKKISRKNEIHKKFEEERTLLSNERTMLSYVRTSLAALVFGFVLLQFSNNNARFVAGGYIALGIGILLLIAGLIHFSILKRRIMEEAEEDD